MQMKTGQWQELESRLDSTQASQQVSSITRLAQDLHHDTSMMVAVDFQNILRVWTLVTRENM